jgi:hypothetical protein
MSFSIDTWSVSAKVAKTAHACHLLTVSIAMSSSSSVTLVQYVLTNSSTQHREIVGSHIRKHMVSLRGSKYGSRVAMLCCNPALTTRPGPPSGMVPRYNNNNNNNPMPRTTNGFGTFR